MQWEMYGPGSTIEFHGLRNEDGYGLRVTRDHATLFVAAAASAASLLQRSGELRGRLQQLGYAVRPLAGRTAQMRGGVCWGPAAPLSPSFVHANR